jgi:hypothetical protein
VGGVIVQGPGMSHQISWRSKPVNGEPARGGVAVDGGATP